MSTESVALTHGPPSVGVAVRAQPSLRLRRSLCSILYPKPLVPSLSLMGHFLVPVTLELGVTATASDDGHSDAGSLGEVTKSEPAPRGHRAKAGGEGASV